MIRLTEVKLQHIHSTLTTNKTDYSCVQLFLYNTISDVVEYVISCYYIIVRMSSDI